jgi:hypothetical protein
LPETMPEIPVGHARVLFSIRDARGEPTTVWVDVAYSGDSRPSTGTYLTGDSHWDLLPGDVSITLRYPQRQRFDLTLAAGVVASIVRRPLGRVEVPTLDGRGAPLNVWVAVHSLDGEVVTSGYSGGRFVADLAPGEYEAHVGYDQPQVWRLRATAGESAIVECSPLGRARIVTPDATGAGSNVWVTVEDAAGNVASSGYSGGAYSCDILPGTYRVTLRYAQAQTHTLHVTAGTETELAASPLGRVELLARDGVGGPASPWITVLDPNGPSITGTYASDGKTWWDLRPGTYEADARYAQVLKVRFDVAAGETTQAVFPALGRLYVAAPLPGVWSSIRTLADEQVAGKLPDGPYHVDLVPGTYRIVQGRTLQTAVVSAGAVCAPEPFVFTGVEIDVPSIAAARPEIGLGAYEIAPDRPGRIRLEARVRAVAADGGVVPEGAVVSVRCAIRSGTPPDVGLGVPDQHGTADVPVGRGEGTLHIWVEPRSDGFASARDSDGRPGLTAVDGVRFDLVVESGGLSAATPPICVVPGPPKSVTEIDLDAVGHALGDLSSPLTNEPFEMGRSLGIARDVPVVYPPGIPEFFREWPVILRAVGTAAPLPAQGAALVLLLIRDAAGNPVVLPDDVQRGVWPFLRFTSFPRFGLRPFVVTYRSVEPAEETAYRLHVAAGPHASLPPGVLPVVVYPGFAFGASTTTFVVRMMRVEAGVATVTCELALSLSTPASDDWQRIQKWFLDGNVDSADTFALEMALSVVPFVGDGLELLRYARKLSSSEIEDPFDHVVAFLALVGLVLDVASIATVGAATPINAAVGGVKAAVKLAKGLQNAAAARQLAEAFRSLMRQVDWSSLDAVVKFAEEIAGFGSLVLRWFADLERLKRGLTYMGLAVGVVQLRPLLAALTEVTEEEAMDLLWMMAALAEAGDSEPDVSFLSVGGE